MVAVLREVEHGYPHEAAPDRRPILDTVIERVCRVVGGRRTPLLARERFWPVVEARAGIAYMWVEHLGRTDRPLAPVLGLRPAAVYKAAARGQAVARRWLRLLGA